MLLLNVSDIHFHHPICNSQMDPDRPFRTRLIQDARARVAELGNVDAILVGGDIAFAGLAEEYEAAYVWLIDLATACGCSGDLASVCMSSRSRFLSEEATLAAAIASNTAIATSCASKRIVATNSIQPAAKVCP